MALEKSEQASAHSEFRIQAVASSSTRDIAVGSRKKEEKGIWSVRIFVSKPISYLLTHDSRSALNTRTAPTMAGCFIHGPLRQIQHSLEVPRSVPSCLFLKLCCTDTFWKEWVYTDTNLGVFARGISKCPLQLCAYIEISQGENAYGKAPLISSCWTHQV